MRNSPSRIIRYGSLPLGLMAAAVLLAASPAWANVNVGRYDAVHIVPAPGPVPVDGNLTGWDTSGEFSTYRFEEQKDRYAFRGCMMYDANYLYIAAHVVASHPMTNMCNPDSESSTAFNGDCLQVRVSTDRALGWPVKDYRSPSDKLAHLTMWYYTPKGTPCLQIAYGMDYHGGVTNPPGFRAAYKKDADGKGYTLEYAIPWKLMHCDQDPPKGGDTLACIWQIIWADDSGRRYGADMSEIRNPKDNGLAYQSASAWGKAVYEKAGRLPAGTVVPLDAGTPAKPNTAFLPIAYNLPTTQPAHVSMHIADANGRTVRWLLGDALRQGGKNTELWNGLNNDGDPVPPGRYTVQWCYHNVKGKLLAATDNAGTPAYNTSDNTGSWAGDYGWPTAIAANDTHVFLAHLSGEASRIMIKLTPQGRRLWGVDPVQDIGPHVIDAACDGPFVYVLAGDFYGHPCATGGFVKVNADSGFNEPIGDLHRSYVRLNDPNANGGDGTAKGLSGIAVGPDTVFVSSEQAGQILCIDKATGKQRSVIANVDKPRGMAVGPNGRLYVVADTTVLSMTPDGNDRKKFAHDLMDPQRVAVAKSGEVFVSVRGFSQQVFRYAADGNLVNAIGRRGGMASPGPWVREAMRRPLGVAVGPNGDIWVTEERMNPKRTSQWRPDGTFVNEYIGPVPYSGATVMDPEDPDHLYSENTQFQIDYATGKAAPSAVIYDDGDHGQDGPVSGGGNTRFIHFQGRTFIAKNGGSLYEMVHNHAVLRVWFGRAAYGPGEGWKGHAMGMGIDRNEDGKIEPAEQQLCAITGGCNWYAWTADNLDIYFGDSTSIWKLPLEGFDAAGVPNYDMAHAKMLLSISAADRAKHPGALPYPLPGRPGLFMTDPQGNIYMSFGISEDRVKRGQSLLPSGDRIIKLSPDFKVLWEYRNVAASMGSSWNTIISKPGEVEGICNFTGELGRYLTVATYFGQYHVLDKETGLYIVSLTPDMRTDPPLDEMAVCAENFNGIAVYSKKLNKSLYCGGDADARLWEIQGLDQVRFADFPVTVTEADARKAMDCRKLETGVAPQAKLLPACQRSTTRADADLAKWAGAEWAEFRVDDARKGRAAVSWDNGGTLTVIFDVTHTNPLLNRGGNPSEIFKTGDCVEIGISAAEPDANRPGGKPILGDKRILVAVVQDPKGGEKPVAVLYEPVSDRKDRTPGTFRSPVSTHTFDHVGPFPAAVAFNRRPDGYSLEVQLNAKQLGLGELQMGRRLRADFGALFSDQGGSRVLAKTLWADDSPEVRVTEDVPTESKIRPQNWGWIVLR